jgi:putative intracellular protease/amidase
MHRPTTHSTSLGSARASAALLLCALALLGCATSHTASDLAHLQGQLAARPPAQRSGPILFVLTAAGEQTLANGKKRSTGLFLGEFFEAYRAVRAAGYDVVFASSGGRRPVIDPESLDDSYWEHHPAGRAEAQSFMAHDASLQAPLDLADALAQEARFAGVVVPGGQGVMVDLLEDEHLHALLLRFGETNRPVGLICHAPALLTRLPEHANPWRGRRVTSVSGIEEFYIETFIMDGDAKDRAIGRQLERRGFEHRAAFPGRPFAVRDCNLVTSQNPYSGDEFSLRYLGALAAYEKGERCGNEVRSAAATR